MNGEETGREDDIEGKSGGDGGERELSSLELRSVMERVSKRPLVCFQSPPCAYMNDRYSVLLLTV